MSNLRAATNDFNSAKALLLSAEARLSNAEEALDVFDERRDKAITILRDSVKALREQMASGGPDQNEYRLTLADRIDEARKDVADFESERHRLKSELGTAISLRDSHAKKLAVAKAALEKELEKTLSGQTEK